MSAAPPILSSPSFSFSLSVLASSGAAAAAKAPEAGAVAGVPPPEGEAVKLGTSGDGLEGSVVGLVSPGAALRGPLSKGGLVVRCSRLPSKGFGELADVGGALMNERVEPQG